jgi:hypothetical protein
MKFSRHLTALGVVAALGVTACSDDPTTGTVVPKAGDVPLAINVSSTNAPVGARVAVAVTLDGAAGALQGTLRYDPARLRYIGQSPDGQQVTLVNAKSASTGKVRFVSYSAKGLKRNAALLVFEARGAGYASTLEYDHAAAAVGQGALSRVNVAVRAGATEDVTLQVPADAQQMSVADWKARLKDAAGNTDGANLRPGQYRLNLRYGDIDLDGTVGLFDALGVANAAVGLDQLIVGTEEQPTGSGVDLVIAGNVFPDNGAGVCGNEANGTRVLDVFDILSIENEVAGINEVCVGELIPGRGPLVTTRQSITATSSPDLIVGPGETVTLTNDRIWQLEGILDVQNGGVLNIQPGTRIEGLTTAPTTQAVFVRRGGQIFANGTAQQPIVFTCTAVPKFKGCWGGVFIAGRGTVNLGDGVADPATPTDAGSGGANSRVGEGNAPRYGGNIPTDNSGVIRFARFEYGGKIVGVDNELNNFTLGAVGSGTVVEYVQVHGGSDDGIEFFGGDLSTRYILATGNDDDGFDVSFGLRGDHQFVIVQSDIGAPSGDSKAIEADGNEPAPGSAALPRTSPRLWNFTIIGDLTARNQVAAIHLRRGSGLRLYNSIVHGYANGLDIDDPLTCDAFGDGPIQIRHTTFIDVTRLDNPDSGDPVCNGATNEAAFITADPTNRNITGIASVLRAALNTNLPDWSMLFIGGAPAEGNTLAPSAVPGSNAVATNYRGAVSPAFGVIPWYSGWTIPFQSATNP